MSEEGTSRECVMCRCPLVAKREGGVVSWVRKEDHRLASLLKVAEEMDAGLKEVMPEGCWCVGEGTCSGCRARAAFADWKKENP